MNKKKQVDLKKIIKPISKLPFDIKFDFIIGKTEKYKDDKEVIKIIKEEIESEKKDNKR